MMKKYIIIIFLISFVIPLNAKDNGILNPQLYNVWTLEELALKMMTQEEIDYYVNANPEDSMKQINYGDKIIVIESKKNLGNIYEVRYGSSGNYQSIYEKQVKWVLPEKLRTEIMEKNYYYVSDDSYIRDLDNSREREYFSNQFHWTNTDLDLSFGSKFIADRFIYRLSSVGGIPISPSNALSIKVGDELLGYPGDSKGMMNLGLLSPYYELGIQLPTFELIGDNPSHIILEDGDGDPYLQGGLGGYGKVLLNQLQVQLTFADMGENKLIRDNVKDSTFVDYLSLSIFAGKEFNFQRPLLKLGYLKGMLGFGYYEISHKSLNRDDQFVDRLQRKNGEIFDGSTSSFIGAMVRADFITPIKRKFPLLHLHAQVNAYEGNSSWQTGVAVNIGAFGLDMIYKHSIDAVDWAPIDEIMISLNYSINASK